MPTRNRCELLKRAVNSALNQSWQDFEFIIVNDGSTDGTADYLAEISANDPRVKVLHNEESQGACAARNRAIDLAQGEYITGLDDDDEMVPDHLLLLMDAFTPDYAFTCSGFYWDTGRSRKTVNARQKVITLSEQLDYNEAGNQVLTLTVRLREVGGFDPDMKACQDYDLWARLMVRYGKAFRVPAATLIIYRDNSVKRISDNDNWLIGQQQFITKHSAILSERNLRNQQFKATMVRLDKLTFMAMIKGFRDGLIKQRIKYFIRSHLPERFLKVI